MESDANKKSEDHWRYIESVLRVCGEDESVIAKCGFHYITAFIHGFKHGVESVEITDPYLDKYKEAIKHNFKACQGVF